MAARYLFPALAIAGRAFAQSSCSTSATLTIQNQGDATGLSSCSTFEGSIEIAEGTTGSIDIPGVEEIDGTLTVRNAFGLTGFSADNLATITGDLTVAELIMLGTLALPMLEDVKGKINLTTLPALQGLQFTKQIKSAGELIIQSTQLYSLLGINLEKVSHIQIAQNGFLQDITMQLANVSGEIMINSNSANNCSVTFPNLIWAGSLNIMNVQSLSIPSLEATNDSLIISNNLFDSFSAPNLTSVGGPLSLDYNAITNISAPLLTSVGGALSILGNNGLEKIDAFSALKTVIGAVNISGTATEVKFPALMDVKGGFNMSSTNDLSSSCKTFQAESGNNKVIKGKVLCNTLKDVDGNSTGTTSSDGSGGSPSPSKGAANPIFISGATGLLGVVAAIFGML